MAMNNQARIDALEDTIRRKKDDVVYIRRETRDRRADISEQIEDLEAERTELTERSEEDIHERTVEIAEAVRELNELSRASDDVVPPSLGIDVLSAIDANEAARRPDA